MPKPPTDLLLLDVNVLIALAWPHHPFHRDATRFMSGPVKWATCATTQLGFLRTSMNPLIVRAKVSAVEAFAILGAMVDVAGHHYLESPPPQAMTKVFASVIGHGQVTDAYLMGLASRHHARFLTLDAKLRNHPGVVLLA